MLLFEYGNSLSIFISLSNIKKKIKSLNINSIIFIVGL